MIGLEEPPVLTPTETPAAPSMAIGRIITGMLVVLVGIGWMVDLTTDVAIAWGLMVPAALMLVGLGVMFGSRRQDVGGLIGIGVLLVVVTVISGALSFIGPWNGVGQVNETPGVAAEVKAVYEHGIGDFVVDLGDVTFAESRTVGVNVGVGAVQVIVPPDATVVVKAETGIGKLVVFGETVDGVGLSMDRTAPGAGPTIYINAELGIGDMEIGR